MVSGSLCNSCCSGSHPGADVDDDSSAMAWRESLFYWGYLFHDNFQPYVHMMSTGNTLTQIYYIWYITFDLGELATIDKGYELGWFAGTPWPAIVEGSSSSSDEKLGWMENEWASGNSCFFLFLKFLTIKPQMLTIWASHGDSQKVWKDRTIF